MSKIILSLLMLTSSALAQYKNEPAGAPPSALAPDVAKALQTQGVKILNEKGTAVCEIWFRSAPPSGPKSTEDAVSFPTIPVGALLGAVRFPAQTSDRRGQTVKPGVYTFRYVLVPVNGDHLGVAPQRDFVALIPASDDKDPKATPSFENVVSMSKKASGTPHPAVLSIAAGSGTDGFSKEGEHDWTLNTKMGDTPIAIILIGKAEG